MDHINNSYKWSFRVNLKVKEELMALRNLPYLFHTRGSDQLSEFIGHKLINMLV